MMLPPSIVRLRVRSWPTLWLPLFLLWPLLFVLLWPLFAIGLIALFWIKPAKFAGIGACLAQLWRVVCALRGTDVDLEVADIRAKFTVY